MFLSLVFLENLGAPEPVSTALLVAGPLVLSGAIWFWMKGFDPGRVNKREEWNFAITAIVGVFGVAGSLVALSSLNSKLVTQSSCVDPPGLNVTSPNCKVIETMSLPSQGPFNYLGGIGIWLGVSTLIFVSVFALLVALFYVLYYREKER